MASKRWFDEPFDALKPIMTAIDGDLLQVWVLVGAIVLPALFVAGATWSSDQRRGRRVARTAISALVFNVLTVGGVIAYMLSVMGMQGAGP